MIMFSVIAVIVALILVVISEILIRKDGSHYRAFWFRLGAFGCMAAMMAQSRFWPTFALCLVGIGVYLTLYFVKYKPEFDADRKFVQRSKFIEDNKELFKDDLHKLYSATHINDFGTMATITQRMQDKAEELMKETKK